MREAQRDLISETQHVQQGKGGGMCGADKDSGEAAEGLGPVSCV